MEYLRSLYKRTGIKNGHVAVIMAALLLFLILFSVFYEALEADHECCGEDCPICAMLIQCENLIRTIGNGITALLCICAVFSYVYGHICKPFFEITPVTLVAQKVRMND